MSYESTFLSSILANPKGGLLTDNNMFRRYGSFFRSCTNMGKIADMHAMRILYEIGRRKGSLSDYLRPTPPSGVVRADASYRTNTVLLVDFVGQAKKYSNFGANFEYSSLAGLAERIALGIATYSVFGKLTSTQLAGGNPIKIHALGVFDSPVNAMDNLVFVPRLVNSILTNDIFAVIIAAAAGEGSQIATDILDIDRTTARPIVPVVADGNFAMAAVSALRLIGANMNLSEQGPLFALAVTRGIHKALSVVGHTDEGSVHRSLFRCGAFGAPFGGIHHTIEQYTGIPAFSMSGISEVCAWVDGIALTTAAAVSISDPGVMYNESWYPTVYDGTAVDDKFEEAGEEKTVGKGEETSVKNGYAARNRNQLVSDYVQFLEIYLPTIAKIFGLSGQIDVPVRFQSTVGSQLKADERHLQYASITPHFWIEPTSLLPENFMDNICEREGFGSFGGKNQRTSRSAFEAMELVNVNGGMYSSYYVKMRGARTSGLIQHLNMHPMDGLGAVCIKQADPLGILQPGGSEATPVSDRIKRGASMNEYLWVRGQSPICAPGEFINIKPTYGIQIRHGMFDADGYLHAEHVPASWEMMNCTVEFDIGVPTGIPNGASNSPDSNARRAKTRALKELSATNARSRIHGRMDISELPVLLSAPVITDRPRPLATNGEGASGTAASFAANFAVTRDKNGRSADTEAIETVIHNNAMNGPQIDRPNVSKQSGGGIAQPEQCDSGACNLTELKATAIPTASGSDNPESSNTSSSAAPVNSGPTQQ